MGVQDFNSQKMGWTAKVPGKGNIENKGRKAQDTFGEMESVPLCLEY